MTTRRNSEVTISMILPGGRLEKPVWRLLSAAGITLFPNVPSAQERRTVDRLITPENVTEHAERIIRQYVDNVADITAVAAARDIIPVFFWQPDIYSTRKPLTRYEQDVRAEHPSVKLLSEAVRERLLRETELRGYLFFDLYQALDGLGPDAHFFDYCHLSEEGNRQAA